MGRRDDLKQWVYDAVKAHGEASIIETAKHIWRHHSSEIEGWGDGFYTWQYDMRWAAQVLRDERKLVVASNRKWALATP